MTMLHSKMHFGVEPGLRFAMLLKADGCTPDLTWDQVKAWRPEDGFLWVHLERDHEVAQDWVTNQAGIDMLAAQALLAPESRPRVQDIDDNLLIVLRGVNMRQDSDGDEATTSSALVPIHLWMEAGRCISLRDHDHFLTALRDLRQMIIQGKGPRSAAGLLARIAEKVTDHLGDLVEELEDEVTALETQILDRPDDRDISRDIALTRRRVVQVRRYLAPQRDALFRLRHDEVSWLDDAAKNHLREVGDRLSRHMEDLEEMRQRATILQEERATMVTEQGNRNTFILSVVSVIMLPMTFLTGWFGMNTGALPFGTEHPYGTWVASGIILVVGVATALSLKFGLFGPKRR